MYHQRRPQDRRPGNRRPGGRRDRNPNGARQRNGSIVNSCLWFFAWFFSISGFLIGLGFLTLRLFERNLTAPEIWASARLSAMFLGPSIWGIMWLLEQAKEQRAREQEQRQAFNTLLPVLDAITDRQEARSGNPTRAPTPPTRAPTPPVRAPTPQTGPKKQAWKSKKTKKRKHRR